MDLPVQEQPAVVDSQDENQTAAPVGDEAAAPVITGTVVAEAQEAVPASATATDETPVSPGVAALSIAADNADLPTSPPAAVVEDLRRGVSVTGPAVVETDAQDTASAPAAEMPAAEPADPVEARYYRDARVHLADVTLRTYPEVGEAIIAFYGDSARTLWTTPDGVNDKAKAVMAELAKVDRFALSPDDYRVELPDLDFAEDAPAAADAGGAPDEAAEVEEGPSLEDRRAEALMAFEMELSAKLLTYALDASRGRVDPNKISEYHDLPRKDVDLAAVLAAAAGSDDAAELVAAQNPQGAHFQALAAELVRLKGLDEQDRIVIAPGTLLKPGRSDPETANVIKAIVKHASAELKEKHAETLAAYQDGEEYTLELVALVKDYQRENRLAVDGIVGPGTIRSLIGDSNADKIAKVELAMERARWLPGDLGKRHIFVNQPAYMVAYNRPDDEPLKMRVVVGKPSNQTSFFMDKLETVEFNPYWGVPLSIIVNEMMPKLNADPSYLDHAGYEVTTVSGKRVSSASVDWYGVASRSSSINVRQLPGRSNALGELKILFPNKHHIYMHDTPAKSLFKRDRRAFSHGCIRLHDPRAMAAAVLGKSEDYIASRIAQGKNESDPVTDDIPIYVSYFTAWPEKDGTVNYFADVYSRDKYLTKALAATEKVRSKS
ncbi:MAG: murein L,D-transpeptidase [Hyphomicrobiales bacterium]|nr:MAG: murein L,D-transpeptidase [Hyphomicrobiales bacterium]